MCKTLEENKHLICNVSRSLRIEGDHIFKASIKIKIVVRLSPMKKIVRLEPKSHSNLKN